MHIAVTGADGFIGRELCGVLRRNGYEARAFGRSSACGADHDGWRGVLSGVDAVIHLAGRAHVIKEVVEDPLKEFRKVNVDGTLGVAQAAREAGVSRFVFVSSIGVLGNDSGSGVFSEETRPAPGEPYAVSKHEAELALRQLEQRTGLEVVIVRPPLVYGAHVKGNFHRLLRLVAMGIPLPLGSVANHRSFVGVTNLSELLLLCAARPIGAHRLFVVSDGHDLSTPELLGMLASRMKRPKRIFQFSTTILRGSAALLGRQRELQRLTGNLRVNSTLARSALGWTPSKSLETGIGEMVDWFVRSSK
jgi:UDP-glucose 4-epimerase